MGDTHLGITLMETRRPWCDQRGRRGERCCKTLEGEILFSIPRAPKGWWASQEGSRQLRTDGLSLTRSAAVVHSRGLTNSTLRCFSSWCRAWRNKIRIVIFYFTTENIYFKLRKWRAEKKKEKKTLPKPYHRLFLAKRCVCWPGEVAAAAAMFSVGAFLVFKWGVLAMWGTGKGGHCRSLHSPLPCHVCV